MVVLALTMGISELIPATTCPCTACYEGWGEKTTIYSTHNVQFSIN